MKRHRQCSPLLLHVEQATYGTRQNVDFDTAEHRGYSWRFTPFGVLRDLISDILFWLRGEFDLIKPEPDEKRLGRVLLAEGVYWFNEKKVSEREREMEGAGLALLGQTAAFGGRGRRGAGNVAGNDVEPVN